MSELAPEWRLWIGENLARGVDRREILDRLLGEGVPRQLASRTVEGIERTPRHRPGLAARHARLDALCPERLAERWGDLAVEVTVDRDDDTGYGDTFHRRVRAMRVRDLVGAMQGEGSTDVYLVASNQALARTELREMLEAVELPTGWSRPQLWMGPTGTLTPFHYDPTHLLALQLHGRKRWRLVSPIDRAWLAQVGDAMQTLHEPSPEVTVREWIVEAGDALEVPAGWWHQVRALEPSVTLSLIPTGPDRG